MRASDGGNAQVAATASRRRDCERRRALRPRAARAARARLSGAGPEATQQRVHGERDDADDGDLAQRVEAAEVDEDDVDDVAAAAPRSARVRGRYGASTSTGGRVMIGECERSPRRRRPATATTRSRARRARALSVRAAQLVDLESPRHPAQARAGSARSSRPRRRSASARDPAPRTRRTSGRSTRPAPPTMISAASRWILRLRRGADRARRADDPQQREHRIDRRQRHVAARPTVRPAAARMRRRTRRRRSAAAAFAAAARRSAAISARARANDRDHRRCRRCACRRPATRTGAAPIARSLRR